MNIQHQGLEAGRWKQLAFLEKMANVGSEVERAFNWRAKKNLPYAERAFERALELFDLTLDSIQGMPRLKETARARETFVDCFMNSALGNTGLRKYFLHFTYAARKNR